MKANELRIGNYIKVEGVDKPIKVSIIDTTKTSVMTRCKPIPLTEKWLVDFKFRKTNESEDVEWYNLNGFEIAIHEEDGDVYFVYQHMVLRHIVNVHQLQNLYFALTGAELTY